MSMTHDQETIDALVRAFDTLTGLLYGIATDEDASRRDLQLTAAAQLGDDLVARLQDVPHPDGDADARRSSSALRASLDLLAEAAEEVGDGGVERENAVLVLFDVVEQLGELVDLEWLRDGASPAVQQLLPTTVALIGELVAREDDHDRLDHGVPDARQPQTLTVLVGEDAAAGQAVLGQAVLGLYAARVPHSIVRRGADGRARETLWLRGMERPLRRELVTDALGIPRPVLTWEEHVALLDAADDATRYAELVAAYLGSSLHDSVSEAEIAALRLAAEAIARA